MTGEQYQVLTAEIRDDPLGRGYANLSAQEAADSLNARNRTRVVPLSFVNAKTLYARLGAAVAEMIIQKLEAGAASDSPLAPILKRACQWIRPSEQGIDVGNPVTRTMVDALTGGLLTEDEARLLKGLAEESVSRAEELGLPYVGGHHVEYARTL